MSLTEKCVSLTQKLVRLPSESSDFTLTDSSSPEAKTVKFLCDFCGKFGIEYELQEVFPGRNNFLAFFPASNSNSEKILISAHMDTVSASDMDNAFKANISDNKIWGRGACDDKGPMAAALTAIINLHQQNKLSFQVVFAATVDEECSLSGSAALVKKIGAFDLIIGLEPTNLRLVNAHKGVYRCKITTKGKAAHSSCPDRGDNAIISMHPIITDLLVLGFRLKRTKDPELGRSTLAITKIEGGSSINIIPESCSISIDIRLLPGQEPGDVSQLIRSVVAGRAKVEDLFVAKGIKTNINSPIIKRFQNILMDCKQPDDPTSVAYATDCSMLIDNGPCIVWGPGSINQAHQHDEHIEIDQLEKSCEILTGFLSIPYSP